MKKILIATVLLTTIIISCKKSKTDDVIVYPEENTFDNFKTSVAQNSTVQNVINAAYNFEIGVSFKSIVKGNIKTLYVKIPDTSTILLVTIWDKSTQAKLLQTNVKVVSYASFTALDITPLAIEANKEYIISMITNDYYLYKKPASVLINYPFTSGNIIYTASVSANPTAPGVMPTSILNQGNYTGDVYFKFQQTQ